VGIENLARARVAHLADVVESPIVITSKKLRAAAKRMFSSMVS
jgi:hypothetical protein